MPLDRSSPLSETRERPKRSRVTTQQLSHLERLFVEDRSPTAVRRKEISVQLGMTERQTQIWFQNRRAKAKLQARCLQGQGDLTHIARARSLGNEAELRARIHEDDRVIFLYCTELAIGTWRRIAADDHVNLLAYISEERRCLAWFIHCAGTGFKMEIPFSRISNIEVVPKHSNMGVASLTLIEPPTFFREHSIPPLDQHAPKTLRWKQCVDWTEDAQATKVLRHDLVGFELELSQVFQLFSLTGASRSPTHSPSPQEHCSEDERGLVLPLPRSNHAKSLQPLRRKASQSGGGSWFPEVGHKASLDAAASYSRPGYSAYTHITLAPIRDSRQTAHPCMAQDNKPTGWAVYPTLPALAAPQGPYPIVGGSHMSAAAPTLSSHSRLSYLYQAAANSYEFPRFNGPPSSASAPNEPSPRTLETQDASPAAATALLSPLPLYNSTGFKALDLDGRMAGVPSQHRPLAAHPGP